MKARGQAVVCAAAAALVVVAVAGAARPPTLMAVGHEKRHPFATFVVGGADWVTVYVATKPDRATDGHFLSENVKVIDFLTTQEIQSGRWLSRDQLIPGDYFIMLRVSGADCWDNPNCIDGFSNVLPLAVPNDPPSVQFLALTFTTILGRGNASDYVRVNTRVRVCDDIGGSLSLLVVERRVKAGRTKARARWTKRLSMEAGCAVQTVRWRLARKFVLVGLGRYVVMLRVRDSEGALSEAVSRVGFES